MDSHWSNLGVGPYKNVAASIVTPRLVTLKRSSTLTAVPEAKRAKCGAATT